MSAPSILDALLATQPLARLPRTGWLLRGVASPETVAAHSHGACLVALALGPGIEPALDVDRAVALLVVHDVPEALLSDLPRPGARLLPAGAKQQAEERAAELLLPPLSELAATRHAEYLALETREARFAQACDRLHMGVALIDYLRAGQRGLDDFVEALRGLECADFAPCEALRLEILAAAESSE